MLKKLNNYFLCDPDETPPVTDYIFVYGTNILFIIIAIFFIVGLVKGVN